MFQKRSLQFCLWLGRGRSLNPYFQGVLVDRLRKEVAPLDLKLFSDEVIRWGIGKRFP